MFGLGMGEILIILVFALLFIGPKKLPQLARSIGKGLREFQKAKQGIMDDIHHSTKDEGPPFATSTDSVDEVLPAEEKDIEASYTQKKTK